MLLRLVTSGLNKTSTKMLCTAFLTHGIIRTGRLFVAINRSSSIGFGNTVIFLQCFNSVNQAV